MLDHRDAMTGQYAGHFLGLSQYVSVNHGGLVYSKGVFDSAEQLFNDLLTTRQPVDRFAKSGLHDQDIGTGRFGSFGREGRSQFEVAGVEQSLLAVVGQ